MKFGIYRLEGINDEGSLCRIDQELGVPVGIRSYYRAWSNCCIADDLPWFEALARSPRDVLLTWEPWRLPAGNSRPEEQPEFSLHRILSGQFDTYIRDVARTLAELPLSIYLRPLHEMNGNWYPWCGTVNGNSPDEFALVWHHLRNLFQEEHAANITWVWSPYVHSYPENPENQIERYFPGDDAVDLIGLDGYNWGTDTDWGRWQSFVELFTDAYQTVTGLSGKDILIAEIASAEGGGDKASWIAEMLARLPSGFPQVRAVVWFDVLKECDWRLCSSEHVLNVFQQKAPDLFEGFGVG